MKENYKLLLKDITYIENYNKDELDKIDNLDKFITILNQNEREILNYHYGLKDSIIKTIEEVANKYDISIKKVKNIEKIAFRKLRILFYLNNNQVIFDPDTIVNNVESLLEIQKSYDYYYGSSKNDLGSDTTQFYKKVIEIAQKERKYNSAMQKKLTIK